MYPFIICNGWFGKYAYIQLGYTGYVKRIKV